MFFVAPAHIFLLIGGIDDRVGADVVSVSIRYANIIQYTEIKHIIATYQKEW